MKVLILFVSSILLAETPKVTPAPDPAAPRKLSDAQRALLYKSYADSTAAATSAKEKLEIFEAVKKQLRDFCGSDIAEPGPGKMAECAAPPADAKKEPAK